MIFSIVKTCSRLEYNIYVMRVHDVPQRDRRAHESPLARRPGSRQILSLFTFFFVSRRVQIAFFLPFFEIFPPCKIALLWEFTAHAAGVQRVQFLRGSWKNVLSAGEHIRDHTFVTPRMNRVLKNNNNYILTESFPRDMSTTRGGPDVPKSPIKNVYALPRQLSTHLYVI